MVNILHAKAAGCCQTSSLIGGFVGRHAKAVKTSQRRLRGSHYRPDCNGFGPPCGLIAARFAPLPILFCVEDVFLNIPFESNTNITALDFGSYPDPNGPMYEMKFCGRDATAATNNSSMNFAARISATPATQPRHSLCAGLFKST